MTDKKYTLGIDIGSTTVKIAILNEENQQTSRKHLPICSGKPTKNWAN